MAVLLTLGLGAPGCEYVIDFPGDTASAPDCDALSGFEDRDGDGYGDDARPACDGAPGATGEGGDCDDDLASVHPGASEIRYNGVDDDCDPGTLDDDLDGDGFPRAEDCLDSDPLVHPGAEEICGDGVDNDCDGGGDGCQPWGTIGLERADAKLLGEDAGHGAGGSGSWVGDVDGDGLDDLLIGAPTWSSETDEAAGAAYLITGMPRGLKSLGEADARIEGYYREQYLSGLIAGVGDINGDGFDDLLLGSKALSTGSVENDGSAGVGPAFLVLGGAIVGARPLDGDAADVITLSNSAGTGEFIGQDAAGPVDFDGDGLDDVALGVWRLLPDLEQDGAAYLFDGDGLGDADLSQADWRFSGVDLGGSVQYAVGALGDLDGDGLGDLAVGASKADDRFENGGTIYVLLGGWAPGDYRLSAADSTLIGELDGAEAGRAVSGAGDVDADGYQDLLVGAWEQETGTGAETFEDAGAVYLVYGPLDDLGPMEPLAGLGAKLLGYQSELRAGRPVGPAGDIDADGHDDFVIGGGLVNPSSSDLNESRGFLVMGPVQPGTYWLDGGDPVVVFKEERRGDWGGAFILGPGDVNGDGLDDLLVGAPNESSLDDYAGAAYLFTTSGI